MSIIAGSWTAKYNAKEIDGIESVSPSLNINTTDLSTIKGVSDTITTGRSVSVAITIIDTDIDNVKDLVGNAYVPAGTQIPGQPEGTVAGEKGAILFGAPECGEVQLTAPFELIPCESPESGTITLYDAVGEITNFSLEDTVYKLEITLRSKSYKTQMTFGAVTAATPTP